MKAANWEMSQGNYSNARSDFSSFRSLLAMLQRAIRINKHSQLLWKEYFRFELGYVNLIEERRHVLGLSVGLFTGFERSLFATDCLAMRRIKRWKS